MIKLYEDLSINTWPSLNDYQYDGWLLRTSSGFTKRTNSVNCLSNSCINLNTKIKFCEDFYNSLDIIPTFKILNERNFLELDTKLESLLYSKLDETSVRILDLKDYKCVSCSNIETTFSFTDKWITEYKKSANINDDKNSLLLSKMLNKIIFKTIYASYIIDGETIGIGYAVIDNGYIGLFHIYVFKKYRGKGYGTEIINTLINKGMEFGGTHSYLQVLTSNNIATNLYMKLGFKEVYKYWYRRK